MEVLFVIECPFDVNEIGEALDFAFGVKIVFSLSQVFLLNYLNVSGKIFS